MRRTVAYKSLIDELRAARTRAEQLTIHSVGQSPSPQTSFGEITFLQECLGLLALYEQRKAEGWPSTTVEEFDAALRRFRPEPFKKLEGQRRNPNPTQRSLEDWRQPQLSRREQKRIRYVTSQLLWRINRSLLMKVVLDDYPINARPPEISHVEKIYVDRFSVPKDLAVGPLSSTKQDVPADVMLSLLRPITPDEVKVVLKTLKQRSASGPDGWSVEDVSSIGIHALAVVLSCWLMTHRTPRWTKRNRTTLIPKGSGDSREVSSWRPITIGPHLLRLYTKILASPLQETVKLNPLQKTFREVDGCSEHLALLHGAIREAKLRKKSINVVFLDLAKAFDSVNHALLVRGLRRHGIPEHFIEVVWDLYDGTITNVSNGIAITDDIVIRSGVKQGCPLSPLLFNMVMDELVDKLDPSFGFRLSNGGAISTLAFADDLVLISESIVGIRALLTTAMTFLDVRGLSINVRKSASLGLEKDGKRKRVRTLIEPFFCVGSQWIPILGPGDTTRYLGIQIGDRGISRLVVHELEADLERISATELKPVQKIECLRTYVIPRWAFRLSLSRCTKSQLCLLGKRLRETVPSILHALKNRSKE